jgi:hypothetical protein
VSGGEQPLSRLDALRFTRRVVEQQAARQLALIDRWISRDNGIYNLAFPPGKQPQPTSPAATCRTG